MVRDEQFRVIVKIELYGMVPRRYSVHCVRVARPWHRCAHLQDLIAHLEHDRALHSVVLDQKVHVSRPCIVNKRPRHVPRQGLGHVIVKVLEQVRLAFKFFRMRSARHAVMPTRIHVAFAIRNVIEMPLVG